MLTCQHQMLQRRIQLWMCKTFPACHAAYACLITCSTQPKSRPVVTGFVWSA